MEEGKGELWAKLILIRENSVYSGKTLIFVTIFETFRCNIIIQNLHLFIFGGLFARLRGVKIYFKYAWLTLIILGKSSFIVFSLFIYLVILFLFISTYVKFSENLIFVTLWYAYIGVRLGV